MCAIRRMQRPRDDDRLSALIHQCQQQHGIELGQIRIRRQTRRQLPEDRIAKIGKIPHELRQRLDRGGVGGVFLVAWLKLIGAHRQNAVAQQPQRRRLVPVIWKIALLVCRRLQQRLLRRRQIPGRQIGDHLVAFRFKIISGDGAGDIWLSGLSMIESRSFWPSAISSLSPVRTCSFAMSSRTGV